MYLVLWACLIQLLMYPDFNSASLYYLRQILEHDEDWLQFRTHDCFSCLNVPHFSAGVLTWWTGAEHSLNCSLQSGLWWATFGFSIHEFGASIELRSCMFSASPYLLGMQLATLFHSYCSYCSAAVFHWLTTCWDTTWILDPLSVVQQMIKFHSYPRRNS